MKSNKFVRFFFLNLIVCAFLCFLLASDTLSFAVKQNEGLTTEARQAFDDINFEKARGHTREAVAASLRVDTTIARRRLSSFVDKVEDAGEDRTVLRRRLMNIFDSNSFQKKKVNFEQYSRYTIKSLKEKMRELEQSILKDIHLLKTHMLPDGAVHDTTVLSTLKHSIMSDLEHLKHIKQHLKQKLEFSEEEVSVALSNEPNDDTKSESPQAQAENRMFKESLSTKEKSKSEQFRLKS